MEGRIVLPVTGQSSLDRDYDVRSLDDRRDGLSNGKFHAFCRGVRDERGYLKPAWHLDDELRQDLPMLDRFNCSFMKISCTDLHLFHQLANGR